MDLIKLIGELQTYRSQVLEAIAAMEQLALRRGLRRGRVKRTGRRAARKTPRAMLVKPVSAKPKRRRAARKNKSR
jgi:hypothetical protein